MSFIANDKHESWSLVEYINEHGKIVLGANCDKFYDLFILMIRFILWRKYECNSRCRNVKIIFSSILVLNG